MRRIELDRGSLTTFSGQEVHYDIKASLIAMLGNAPVNGGLNVSDVRQRVTLLEKLEQSEDHLEVEEAQWEYLKNVLNESQFLSADKHVVRMLDAVENAESV